MKPLRLGIVGLDTSHVTAFAELLHNPAHPHHVPGGRIVAGYPGGSPDLAPSIGRLERFTGELRNRHGVRIVQTIAQLKDECDALLLASVDGRVHLEQFREIADWRLPVFIDKPLACHAADARAIADLAAHCGTPVMSASALRFGESLLKALSDKPLGPVTGGDFFGPMPFVDKIPGYLWYGIHTAEMLYAAMGAGCREVRAIRHADHDIIVGQWADGRIGTARGNRTGNNTYGGTIHHGRKSRSFDISASAKPFCQSLLERIIAFLESGSPGVPMDESIEVIRFLEAANESAPTGNPVLL